MAPTRTAPRSEVVVVEGVLIAAPSSEALVRKGKQPPGRSRYTGIHLLLDLRPWRIAGTQEVHDEVLRVEVPIDPRDPAVQVDKLAARRTVRVHVSSFGAPEAGAAGSSACGALPVVVRPADPKLARTAGEEPAPAAIRDAELGRLVFDADTDSYCVGRRLGGRRYALAIQAAAGKKKGDAARDGAAIEAARAVVTRIETTFPSVLADIGDRVLPLYNRVWNEGAPIDRNKLVAKLALDRLTVLPRGRARLRFRSGTMFTDHLLEVVLGATGAVVSFGLV